jgi:putative peptidoglycan lipid II flippase
VSADEPRRPRRIVRNTAIFSVATGLSRIAGLVREVVAGIYFATRVEASAFTIAFAIPNLLRSLVADSALSAAFVPVFTELLEKEKKREAYALAGALFGLILTVLGTLTVLGFLLSPYIVPHFTSSKFTKADDDLTVGLTQVLFPIVVLLGLNGLVVGVLNAYDHFSIPAIAPLVWNVVIIAGLVGLRPLFDGPHEVYAYAIGVLAGTAVQFAMALPVLKRIGFPLKISFGSAWRDPRIRKVMVLMLPVTIGLGLINFNLFINSALGTKVSTGAPRAIDAAFRIYMLPQGMFSVAIATVLFPQLSRLAANRDLNGLRAWSGAGVRQIALVLIPCGAATAVLAEPITRLIYEHGDFGANDTKAVSEALFWFSFSLPFAGMNLMLTRTFFSLQRPWTPTKLAGITLAMNVGVSLALYKSMGIGGIVLGTVVSSAAMMVLQAGALRAELNGFEIGRTIVATAWMLAASLLFAGAAYATWWMLDDVIGRSLLAQVVSVSVALAAGTLVYTGTVLLARVHEAEWLMDLLSRRLRRAA